MKKYFFTLIELLLSIAITSILVGVLAPLIIEARDTARYNEFKNIFGEKLVTQKEWANIRFGRPYGEDVGVDPEFSNKLRVDVVEMSFGKKKPSDSEYFLEWKNKIGKINEIRQGSVPENQETGEDLYDRWAQFTGNPKKLTRQQWETLYEANLIEEVKYNVWKQITGNQQSLSEKEFNVLKEKKLITFPVSETKNDTQNW